MTMRMINVLLALADGTIDRHGKDRAHVDAALHALSRVLLVRIYCAGTRNIVTASLTPRGERYAAIVAARRECARAGTVAQP